ncbi:MAG: nucleotidyltransferase family protein [Leptospiraceae bacterium]|nr:nucleotidyltransferase family protein [Leptospiraceae bacterium]
MHKDPDTLSPGLRQMIQARARLVHASMSDPSWLISDPLLGFIAPLAGLRPVDPRRLARYVLLREVLKQILLAFAERQIPAMLLKGLHYADSLYPNPAIRPTQDIDLLVPPDRFQEAAMLLQEKGFRLQAGSPFEQSRFRTAPGYIELPDGFDPTAFLCPGEVNLQHPGGADVDLHWHISPDPFLRAVRPLPMNQFWQSAPELSGYESDLLYHLARPLELFYMLFTWHRNGFRSNYALVDMDLLLQQESDQRALWEQVADFALRNQSRLFVYRALRLRERICGADAAGVAITRLEPGFFARWRTLPLENERSILSKSKDGIPNRQRWFIQWMCVDRWTDTIKLLLVLICPPRAWLVFRYGSAGHWLQHWKRMLGTIFFARK